MLVIHDFLVPKLDQVVVNIWAVNHLFQNIQIQIIFYLPQVSLVIDKCFFCLVLSCCLEKVKCFLMQKNVMGKRVQLLEKLWKLVLIHRMCLYLQFRGNCFRKHSKCLLNSSSCCPNILWFNIGFR